LDIKAKLSPAGNTVTDNLFERRILNYRLLMVTILAAIMFIVVKLFYMQIIASDFYRKASEENGIRMVPILAPRGLIVDRNGESLVKSRASYSMYLLPYEVVNLDVTCEHLATVLSQDPVAIKEKIHLGWQGKFQPIRLERDVDFQTVAYIEEHTLDFPGITFQVESIRQYPVDNYGSHVWGYVGEVTEQELTKPSFAGYSIGDIIGKEGLEKEYEEQLRGQNGFKYLEVTAAGKILGEYPGKPMTQPIRGSALDLEIDWGVQEVAERELASQGSGAIVAIDPRNGAVRALASVPEFDANAFSGVITPQEWKDVSSDSLHPLFNRAMKGTFPPGSTFKPFTAAAGLESGAITEESHFQGCRGAMRFGNRVFKCWDKKGHGALDLISAIIQSCDVYFYQLGLHEGLDAWGKEVAGCGFGKRTGIDLPGELTGLAPSQEYFNKRYGNAGWTKYLVVNLAIGQGEVLVTPLQMAMMYAAIANDGNVYKPRLVSKIISPMGDTTFFKPELAGKLPMSTHTLEVLHQALVGVVNDPRGTAHQAAVKGFTVAGKTGTAQNPHGNDHAWFVCYAPADKPEIAVAVLVENAGHGGSIAAPVARKVLEKYFGVGQDSLLASMAKPVKIGPMPPASIKAIASKPTATLKPVTEDETQGH
jgi:penicillin-binding protein 2